jgi:redox-sensitive bicupin YhaK (pirin superfamily)
MITIRPSAERGYFDHGWLQTRHTFSFAAYHDPDHMGFRALRVINEDIVQAERGFGTHPHRDMEIITYVLEGALEHRDSMDNRSVIPPGEVQRMTAGTGVTHSEYNASKVEPVHLLQIWILPDRVGLTPSYEQRPLAAAGEQGLILVASPDGADGSLRVHQDVRLWAARLTGSSQVELSLAPGRYAWVQLVSGSLTLNGSPLEAGDGAALADEDTMVLAAENDGQALVFDLA